MAVAGYELVADKSFITLAIRVEFLYVKKSSFSLRTCYQIILKGKNGQERYFGKL